MAVVEDPIQRYVADVGAALGGARRLRIDMLTEMRDGLEDAAYGYQEAGLPAHAAREQAVAEFGPAPQIAAELQEVIAARHGRRLAWSVLWVLGVECALSQLLGMVGHWDSVWGDDGPSQLFLWLAKATSAFTVLTLGAATLTAIGLRRRRLSQQTLQSASVFFAIAISLTLVAEVGLTLATPGSTLLAALVPAAPLLWVLVSAQRCWRAANKTRLLAGAPQ
jgi:cation transport ATPase